MNKELPQKYIDTTLKLAQELQKGVADAKDNIFVERIGPIVNAPKSKIFLIKLMDVAFRSSNYKKVSGYVMQLFKKSANYKGLFKWHEKILVNLYKYIGSKVPNVSIPLMLSQIQSITNTIVFYVGDKRFDKHSENRKKEGVKLNVNLIGETLVGEGEAMDRIVAYKHLINETNVHYISIKISTIYSHISPVAYDYTVKKLVERLSILYDEVLKIEKGTGIIKFINLDMEEYRDMSLTVDTFINTLSLPRFKDLRAGIVLQAYVPDSYNYLLKLQKWALDRIEKGGAPIKIRIVKGANMEMEMTESSLEDWPLVTFDKKEQSDANYKKMLLELLTEESCKAVNLGVASHNVFDLSFAMTLVKENNLSEYVDFEMLEGMANAMVNQLLGYKMNVLLYTPIVHPENYTNAIAYLVRRLDEGTADGNFLKESIGLKFASIKWKELKNQFLKSVELIDTISAEPKRKQNRNTDKYTKQEKDFHTVANTDWVLKENQQWIEKVKKRWMAPIDIFGDTISVVGDIDKKQRETIEQIGWNGKQPWKYELADVDDYKQVLESTSSWYKITHEKRIDILLRVAVEIEKNRGDLIGVAVTELGKLVTEVDVEVSEAIDFANYYAYSLEQILDEGVSPEVGGINLVLSPWNFPVAIPCGGVLASLVAGKRVILKPSQNAAATAYVMCKCLWDAGVPKDALLFLPTKESNLDEFLTDGNTFDAVILTGGTDTAKFLLNRNPRLNLYAETGGKNSTIITSLSDREQGIKNVVNSAFGNTGQKCSATSLLILEEEVFNNNQFKKLLKDAVESRVVGNPWNFETQIGPLAVGVSDKLKKSIRTTPKNQWLVEPVLEGNFILSPGVKWGVTSTDFEYCNELFGPILSVMKAKSIKEAIKLVNGVEYGLTSGLESLDQTEIDYWLSNIQAGNLYVNRSTTGAIVQRQPFGGMKASNFGFGMKAGGPNYVRQFIKINEKVEKENYQHIYDTHFNKSIDYVKLRGQHNINVYLKPKKILLLVDENTPIQDIDLVLKAANIMKIGIEAYSLTKIKHSLLKVNLIDSFSELESKLSHDVVIRALNYDSLDHEFLKLCHNKAIHIYGNKPTTNGRMEFLNYLNEQNRSINYHRYGNLMGIKEHQ